MDSFLERIGSLDRNLSVSRCQNNMACELHQKIEKCTQRLWNLTRERVMGLILLIILVLVLIGGFPSWPYSRSWGYGPSGLVSVLLLVLLVLLIMDIIPFGMHPVIR
jgi:hypothetical protein